MRFKPDLRLPIIVIALLGASSVWAGVHPKARPSPAAPKEDSVVELEIMDPALKKEDVEKLPGMKNKKLKITEAPQNRETVQSALPDGKALKAAIEKANLKEETAKMDALDRTVLFKTAEDHSFDELKEKYPDLPAAKLKALQDWIRGKKK